MPGYSCTPLFKKLGLKDGMNALFVNPPKRYLPLHLPQNL